MGRRPDRAHGETYRFDVPVPANLLAAYEPAAPEERAWHDAGGLNHVMGSLLWWEGIYFFFFGGTFFPFRLASERPMAIACFRLFTFFPLRPLLSVPFLRLCIADFTDFLDPFPYLAIVISPGYDELPPA